MPLQLFLTRRAAREIDRAAEWWASHRPAAPGAVRTDLETTFALLTQRPSIGTPVPEASSPGVRRFFVDRIRYWIYYRVRDNRLEVVSVWHASRGSGPTI